MPSREEFEAATALYQEAVAMYEAAQAELEALKKAIADTIRRGGSPTGTALAEEDELRAKLFTAADRLSRRRHRRLPPR
jgi:hypothetical protein